MSAYAREWLLLAIIAPLTLAALWLTATYGLAAGAIATALLWASTVSAAYLTSPREEVTSWGHR